MATTPLEILNLMASVDGEEPFEESDFVGTFNFASRDDAIAAFQMTKSLAHALKVQSDVTQIPEAWIERIQNFPDLESLESAYEIDSKESAGDDPTVYRQRPSIEQEYEELPPLFRRGSDEFDYSTESPRSWRKALTEMLFARPQVWGGGFAAACVLLILVQPSEQKEPVPSGLESLYSSGGRSEMFNKLSNDTQPDIKAEADISSKIDFYRGYDGDLIQVVPARNPADEQEACDETQDSKIPLEAGTDEKLLNCESKTSQPR